MTPSGGTDNRLEGLLRFICMSEIQNDETRMIHFVLSEAIMIGKTRAYTQH